MIASSERDSCVRISNASIPPTMNHRNDVTAYSVPMRLWSTVPIQLQIPVSDFGRGMKRGNLSDIGGGADAGGDACMSTVQLPVTAFLDSNLAPRSINHGTRSVVS